MEAEAFPIRFTKGIRSYWRRRKYQTVDDVGGAAGGHGGTRRLVRLGDGGGGGSRPWAVRLGGMFRPVNMRRSLGQAQARRKADELGQKLVLEMYKSVRASRDLTGMLHASTAAAR